MSDNHITCPYDWLLIRAAKDCSPMLKRLRRIWQARCMLPDEYRDSIDQFIAYRLIEILRKCGDVDVMRILESGDPLQAWKMGAKDTDPYWARIVMASAFIIRHKRVDEFPNYHSPARFRSAS